MSYQETSLDVYHNEVKPKLGEKQQRVLDAFERAKRPICNQEMAIYLNQPINTITPRVNELARKGLVVEHGRAAYPETNRTVIYWKKKGRFA